MKFHHPETEHGTQDIVAAAAWRAVAGSAATHSNVTVSGVADLMACQQAQFALTAVTRKTLSVGDDHNLSLRTDLYAAALPDKLTGVASGNTLLASIRHRI